MATITPANSTITDTVNLLLLDTGNTTIFKKGQPYITYISTTTIPGRIATIRDATGYVSTGNTIILSTMKDVTFADGTSSLSITQPYGFVTITSRSTNSWAVINTFAFPDPLGTYQVCNVNVINTVSSSNLNVNTISSGTMNLTYISSLKANTSSINADTIITSKLSSMKLMTSSINANVITIDTINAETINIRSDVLANALYIDNIFTNEAPLITVGGQMLLNAGLDLNATNIDNVGDITNVNSFTMPDLTNGYGITKFFITDEPRNGSAQLGYLYSNFFPPYSIGRNIAEDWIYYPAESNLDMGTNSIINTNILNVTTIQTNNISSVNISASNISTNTLFANTISSVNIFASSISTHRLFANSISSFNIVANSISTNNFFANSISSLNIKASTISTTNLFTSYLQASTISTTSLYTTFVSTSFLQASTVSTLSLNTRNISSLFSQTSSILTGSITLKGSGGTGLVTTNTTGSQLLFNGSQVGTWVGTATSGLDMCNYSISNVTNLNGTAVASIGGASWSQYSATQNVNINGFNMTNVNNLTVLGSATAIQNLTISSNIATNYVMSLYHNFTGTTNSVGSNGGTFLPIIKIAGQALSFTQVGFKYYNTSIQFKGLATNKTSNINYYLSLSNVTYGNEVFGNITDSTYTLVYPQNSLNNNVFSFSFSDVFNTTGWGTNDAIYPQIYCITTNTSQYSFSNVSLNLIMKPVVETIV